MCWNVHIWVVRSSDRSRPFVKDKTSEIWTSVNVSAGYCTQGKERLRVRVLNEGDCMNLQPVLRIRIRDPVPFWLLDLGSGMCRKSASGSGMSNPDHIFQSLETIFLVFLGLKYLNSLMRIRDPESGMETVRIRDGKKSDPGSGINIPDPQHCLQRRSH